MCDCSCGVPREDRARQERDEYLTFLLAWMRDEKSWEWHRWLYAKTTIYAYMCLVRKMAKILESRRPGI